MVSPTTLSGVEAPAVMPMRTSPAGSHPAASVSSCAPIARCRMPASVTHCGLSM